MASKGIQYIHGNTYGRLYPGSPCGMYFARIISAITSERAIKRADVPAQALHEDVHNSFSRILRRRPHYSVSQIAPSNCQPSASPRA